MDDPEHIASLEGNRFIVLRPDEAVSSVHADAQRFVRDRFAGLPISYPRRAHVTLAGFLEAPLDGVLEVAAAWARSVPPLRLETDGHAVFPEPAKIAFVRVRKTPELYDALVSLREMATDAGLGPAAFVPVEDWVFHMSVAYCAEVDRGDWESIARAFTSQGSGHAVCLAEHAEVVAFDDGRERLGGTLLLGPRAVEDR